MLEEYSRVYAKIDLGAIRFNLDAMKNNIPAGTKMMAVIKTDAYGHGSVPIAQMLEKVDYIWGYATATAEEAFELRDAGVQKPILILGYTFPYSHRRMLLEGIRPTVFRKDMAQELSECAKELLESGELKEAAPIHIAVCLADRRLTVLLTDSHHILR